MTKSGLFKLGVIAAALLLGAGYFYSRNALQETVMSGDQLLLPALKSELNNIKTVRLVGAKNTVIAEMQNKDGKWLASNAGDYPVDFDKLRSYLIGLSESKLREAKTSVATSYIKLGVEDIATEQAKGVQVELLGGKAPMKLIIGSIAGRDGDGAYVRLADAKQSYLASGKLRPEASLPSWLQAQILHLPSSRIQQIEHTAIDGGKLVVRKNFAADADWTVQDVPKGEAASSSSVGNELAGALDSLRLESVAKAVAGEIDSATQRKARYTSFEGVIVEVTSWEKNGAGMAMLAASLDPALSQTYIEEAAKTAAAEATAKDPKASFDAEKFKAEKLAELNKEVNEINLRVNGWTYGLPPFKFATLKRSMADMVKKPDTAGTPGNPIDLSGQQ